MHHLLGFVLLAGLKVVRLEVFQPVGVFGHFVCHLGAYYAGLVLLEVLLVDACEDLVFLGGKRGFEAGFGLGF